MLPKILHRYALPAHSQKVNHIGQKPKFSFSEWQFDQTAPNRKGKSHAVEVKSTIARLKTQTSVGVIIVTMEAQCHTRVHSLFKGSTQKTSILIKWPQLTISSFSWW